MTIELIVFVAAILFGILLYWRESNGNGLYRFVNKLVNTKELQMQPDDKTGFVYKQKFLLRLVYVTFLFLVFALVLQFFTPIEIFSNYYGVSTFASSIVGTLIGSYVANFVIKSGTIIEDKSGDITDIVKDVVEKGKDVVEDVKERTSEVVEDFTKKEETVDPVEDNTEEKEDTTEDTDKKSARERLKDKGYL
ncbi:MAG: hypothetical protein ACWA5P_03345 [bacterium]